MCFVHRKHVEHVCSGIDERTGVPEQVGNLRTGLRASQQVFEDLPGRAVLGHVPGQQAVGRQSHQQVYRNDRLPRSRPSLDYDDMLLARRCRLARHLEDGLVGNFLVVDEYELLLAVDHADQGVHEAFRWANPPALDLVDNPSPVAAADVSSQELAQALSFRIALQEQRRAFQVLAVEVVCEVTAYTAIVEVRARPDLDVGLVNG